MIDIRVIGTGRFFFFSGDACFRIRDLFGVFVVSTVIR